MFKTLPVILALSFAAGFGLPLLLRPLLPPSEPAFSYLAIAASFVLNLACLSLALMWLPDETTRGRFPYVLAWLKCSAVGALGHAGLWTVPVHRESWRVFAVLALLISAQTAGLLGLHAIARAILGPASRVPRVVCVLALSVTATALLWTREPILRLSRSGGDGAQNASYMADAVMKLSPPAAVAAAWSQESDSARAQETGAARRFDLVHGTLTYAVWIGSYQTVPTPDIMFSGGGDFYTRREFAPGLVLTLLAWALPLLLLCDLLFPPISLKR